MKPALWLPVAVFLGVSIPALLLLIWANLFTEYRVWISLAAGMLATALTQSRMQAAAYKASEKDQA